MLRFFLIFCTYFLFASLAQGVSFTQAASFDCDKASHRVEHAICADEELSELDDTLAIIFQEKQYGIIRGDQALLDEQRSWLRQMRAFCRAAEDTKVCVRESYEQRLTDLHAIPFSLHVLYEPKEIVRIHHASPHYDFELTLDPPFDCGDMICQEDRQLAIFTKGEKSPENQSFQVIEFPNLAYSQDEKSSNILFRRHNLGKPEKRFHLWDFNFDGHIDLIFLGAYEDSRGIVDKPFVFLYDPEYRGFYYAPSLSRLFHDTLWVKYDSKDKEQDMELHVGESEKELNLSFQDGCCFFVSTTYQVKNNMPVPLRRRSRDSRHSKDKEAITLYEEWQDGKWQITARGIINK